LQGCAATLSKMLSQMLNAIALL